MNATELYLPILFWTFAATSVGGAAAILFVKDIVRCAFLLMLSFSGIAGLYLLLGAEFLAFTQILVYVGGILILILFGVMLTQRNPILVSRARTVHLVVPGTLAAGILLAGLVYVVLKVDWDTKAGEEDRVFLESAEAGAEDAEPADPHALDGWVEEEDEGKTILVRDAGGQTIARFVREEGEGAADRPVARGVTRLDLVRIEDGRVARDHRGRALRRSIHGRLERSGGRLILATRDGDRPVARFEPTKVEMTEKGLRELLGTEELPEALASEEGTVEVSLLANAADPGEVVAVALAGEEPGKHAYALVRGVKADPAVTKVDEYVVSVGPAMDETPVRIGKAFMTDFLLPFEIASVLLLGALIGATVIARRGGIEGAH